MFLIVLYWFTYYVISTGLAILIVLGFMNCLWLFTQSIQYLHKNQDSFSICIFQSLSFVDLCFIFLYINYFTLVIIVSLACLSAG